MHATTTAPGTANIHGVWCLMLETTTAEQTIYFKIGEKFITDMCVCVCAHYICTVQCSPKTTHFYFFCFLSPKQTRKKKPSLLFDSKCAANPAVAVASNFLYISCDSVVVCNMSDIFTAAAAANVDATPASYPATIQTSFTRIPLLPSFPKIMP